MSNLATIVNNILADSGIDDINVVVTNGSYSNPAWITALSWSKITSTPTTLSGYGITDAVPAIRTITINGDTQDLSANRTWTIAAGVTSVNAGTGISVNQTTGAVTVTNTGVLVNDITSSSGQGRFGGWYQGNGYTGAAVEVGYSGGFGYVITYNRATSTYFPLIFNGSNIYLNPVGGRVYIDTSPLVRQSAGVGWLSGNYASSETSTTTGAIYSIGGSYYPTGSTLNSMYGVGYTHTNQGQMISGASSWGFYVTGNGTVRVWLGGDNGNIIASGDIYANTSSLVATQSWVSSQGFVTGGPYLPLSGGTLTGTLFFSNNIGTAIQGTMGNNDFWRIYATGGDNAGYLEIATADDGAEPIYISQYSGVFSTLIRRITLLDGSGNTTFPGTINTTISDYAFVSQSDGTSGVWRGRILSKNATANVSSFLGTYASIAGVFAHNNALSAWADLYVNTVDGSGGGTVRMPSSVLINGNQALHAGNYNSYAPTLTGGGASGTWGINVTGSSGSTGTLLLTGLGNGTVNVNNPNTAVYRNENGLGAAVAYAPLLHLGGGDTMWQIQGTYGSSGSGVLYFRQGYNGSWGTWLTMLSSSNYNNYSPTLTGGGASGTWGINITGNADTVDGYHASTSTIGNYIVVRDGNGYIFGNYINMTDDGNPGSGTSISSFITKQGDNYYRSVSPTNAMASIRGVASGSWGINITGSASSATNATNLYGLGAIQSTSTGTSYTVNYQIRENVGGGGNTNEIYAPQLAFHWSGVVASSIMMESSGRIAIRNNPGSAYESFIASDVYGSSSMRAPIFYDSDNTSYYLDPASTSNLSAITTGGAGTYNLFQTWTQLNGYHGFYSSLNGSHFYVNNGTYGSWRIAGSRNGWNGIEFDASNGQVVLMINPDSNTSGFHNNSYGWHFRWNSGTAYVYKNAYGGGTAATVLDSSNYTSYAPSTTGGGASGTWGISVTGTAAYLPTLYAGGVQSNPQVYFGQSVGLRVAMTGVPFAWCDTLWINGYSGGDVLSMCALHTARNTQPRMWISSQNSNGSSYGTTYEFVTEWNSPYALNMNQYVRTTDSVTFATLSVTGATYLPNNALLSINGESDVWGARFRTTTSTTNLGGQLKNIIWCGGGASEGLAVKGNYGGAPTALEVRNDGIVWAASSFRAPIFYDSDDTTYYADFANSGTSIYTAGIIRSSGVQVKGSSGGGQIYPTMSNGGVSLYGGNSFTNGAYFTVTGIDYGSSPGAGSAEFVIRSEASSKFALFSYNGSTWTGRYGLFGSTGNVTIGDANTDIGYRLYVIGDIYATGDIIAYSDERVKTNVRKIENPLDRILNTRGVVYDRTDTDDKNQIGFIAQELEEHFPELISTSTDGRKGVKYQNMVAVLIEAMKEQQKQIEELKNK